jgi:hypothetical protein
MESKVVLSMIVATAMAVSPAFAAKKDTYELKRTRSAYTSPAQDATGLQAPTPKQVVEKTGG